MKYLRVCFEWMFCIFFMMFPVSLYLSYQEPLPSFDELSKFEGELVNVSVKEKEWWNRRANCSVRLSVLSAQDDLQSFFVSCHDSHRRLKQGLGSKVKAFIKYGGWLEFSKRDFDLYHLTVNDEPIVFYEASRDVEIKTKWIRLFFAITSFFLALLVVYGTYKRTIHHLSRDSRGIKKLIRASKFKVSEKNASVVEVRKLKGRGAICVIVLLSILDLWLFHEAIANFIAESPDGIVYLLGSLFVTVFILAILNGGNYLIYRDGLKLGWQDILCKPSIYFCVGRIKQVLLYKVKWMGEENYYLIIVGSGRRITLFDDVIKDPLETLQHDIFRLTGIDSADSYIETDKLTDLDSDRNTRFRFLLGPPGALIVLVFLVGVFYSASL